MNDYVFGYGSLVDEQRLHSFLEHAGAPASARGRMVTLSGYRRVWNVAMDNGESINGYKRYRCSVTGDVPAVFITYLNIAKQVDVSVHGICFAVDERILRVLDKRERNYVRTDLTADILQPPEGGRVWAYVGSQDGRDRFEEGASEGRAVIAHDYIDAVRSAFESRGLLQHFEETSSTGSLQVQRLHRIDI